MTGHDDEAVTLEQHAQELDHVVAAVEHGNYGRLVGHV
jgi:hypothetical protein